MADISKIKLPNNTEYNIKDTTARATASAAIPSSTKGVANGVAELDANGLVPSSQLPSFVDDVLEYASKSDFPTTGEAGKIYVATDTNLTYRWSGTAYVEISPSLALGETSSTAYRGDRGKTAYTHATDSSRLTTATASGLYKVASTAQGHIASLTAVTKADITGLGIPGSDTNTHRPIQVNGTEVLGNNTTALNLKAGSNVSISNSSGTVTISATDTTYSSKAAVSGGTDVSLVTTGEKYTWNSKAAGDHTHATSIATSTGTNQLTLAFGTKYALTAGGTSYVFTMPANPNTNTTYTLGTSGNNITLTPSSGSAQSITAPYATSAGSATKATQDGSGNTITSTYVKKAGDTMTGELKLYREGTTTQNLGTYLTFQNKDTTTGKTSNGYIVGYDGGENGINLVINPAGNMFIGSGEAGKNHYDLYTHNTGENFYATSDTHIYLQANGQTIANRVGMIITNGHTIVPCKADVTTNNIGSIGTSSARWAGMYAMKYNGLLTGTGTAGQDKGSGTTNRYVPAKWTFNIGSNTVDEGDLFVIKLPVAGHDYGTYLSLNNGTNYYPVIYNTSTRLTSHFPASSCIIVTFDSAGSAGSIFPLNGGDARTTVSGGAFRVVDFYDSGNSTVNQTATTTNANYEVLFSGTADNTTRNEGSRKSNNLTFNPSTGALNVSGVITGGNGGGAWHLGRNNATIKKATAANSSTFYPIWSIKTYTGDWSAGILGNGGESLYFVNTLDSNYSGNINKGRKYKLNGSSNADDNTTYDLVFKTSFTSGQVVVADGTSGLIKTSGYTIAKSVPSNAVFTDTNTTYSFGSSTSTVTIAASATDPSAFSVDLTLTKDNVTTALGYTPPTANTDVNVKVNNTNPASGTWYYPTWYTATSGTGNVNANDGLKYYCLQGTASAAGVSYISVGNSTATGTAGNKRGYVRIYSEKAGYADIVYTASATGNTTHTFPTTGGTILNTGTTSFTQSLSSGTKIGTIKINGTSTDLYCQTNTNTHRPIQVNGTEILGNNTTALNLKAGSNVSVTNASGTVTIAATNTNDAVTQTATTTDATYDVLFSVSTTGTATKTEGARKDSKIAYNPNKGCLKLYNTGDDTDDVLQIYSTTIDGTTTLNEKTFNIARNGKVTCGRISCEALSPTYVATSLKIYAASATSSNTPAQLTLSVKDNTTGKTYDNCYIAAYNDHASTSNGNNMVIRSGGGMFIGSGEAASEHYVAKGASYTGEDCFITADGAAYLQANANIITQRVGLAINASHQVLPVKADTGTNNIGSIGADGTRWANLYVTNIQGGTAINTQYKDTTTNTTGFCMHGRNANNKYSCVWESSKLNFYVDNTNVGNVSDRQLKREIDEIDPMLLEAIAECKIYQYKAFNRDGLISVGIMAQDLVEKCEKRGIRPENYELLTKMHFIQNDDTLYYSVDYNQYATFMIDYLQKKVKELEEKIK